MYVAKERLYLTEAGEVTTDLGESYRLLAAEGTEIPDEVAKAHKLGRAHVHRNGAPDETEATVAAIGAVETGAGGKGAEDKSIKGPTPIAPRPSGPRARSAASTAADGALETAAATGAGTDPGAPSTPATPDITATTATPSES